MPPKVVKTTKAESKSETKSKLIEKENQCLVLQQKGTFRQSTINENSCEAVAKIFRRAQNPELIGKWEKPDVHILMYGYKKGKEGTENKHELPPPYSDITLYSDIALVGISLDNNLKSISHEYWSRFVASIMGEDSDESDEEKDDDKDSDIESEIEEEEDKLESESEEEEEDFMEEEEEEDIKPKKKVKVTKKVSKKLSTYYLHPQLNIEKVEDEYKVPENKVRLQCLKIISDKLKMLSKDVQQNLELGIYNNAIQTCKNRHIYVCYENPEFISMYQIIMRRTITNLDPSSYIKNPGLMERLESESYVASDIASLAPTEMYPEKWRSLIDIQLKRDKHLLEGGSDLEFATDMFKCSRCGKRKCRYYEMQTRSADEAMTVFIKCLVCKKEWKQ
jgi:transcription elongation factor S-II